MTQLQNLVPELSEKILFEIPLDELYAQCLNFPLVKFLQQHCYDNSFWRQLGQEKFPDIYKQLTPYLKVSPGEFFKNLAIFLYYLAEEIKVNTQVTISLDEWLVQSSLLSEFLEKSAEDLLEYQFADIVITKSISSRYSLVGTGQANLTMSPLFQYVFDVADLVRFIIAIIINSLVVPVIQTRFLSDRANRLTQSFNQISQSIDFDRLVETRIIEPTM